MAWIMSVRKMSDNFDLLLEQSPPKAMDSNGKKITLKPGCLIKMRGWPCGTFGVRHTPMIAGVGGSTVCIISERAEWYRGLDSHIGTMRAIMNSTSRPSISYSIAVGKDGSTTSAFSKWTRRHFQYLVDDARTWRDNYTYREDATFTKVHVFWRTDSSSSFIYFGRYYAEKFEQTMLTLQPVATALPVQDNMDILSNAVERLQLMTEQNSRQGSEQARRVRARLS
jgi:hypothetical protein|tara:strand:- start:4664 stop:5338 length:675 start_codon:yes stop_codon:yes gene_type:complete